MNAVRSGRPLLDMRSGVKECFNMRESRSGAVLEGVRGAECLASLSGRPLFSETRGGRTLVFVQRDDLAVVLDAAVEEGKVQTLNQTIGFASARVESVAWAGSFAALRLADGSLEFMRRESCGDGYVWLGKLPTVPEVKVELSAGPRLSCTVPAVRFRQKVDDPRLPLGEAATEPVAQAVENAWGQLLVKAQEAGYFVSGSALRVGLRLWDGELLCVGDPVAVGSLSQRLPDPVSLALEGSAGDYTGTKAGSVGIDTFSIRVGIDGGIPPCWHGIVRHVEVWVTPPDIDVRSFSASVAYSQAASRIVVRVSASDPERRAVRALCDEMTLAARLLPSQLPASGVTLDPVGAERTTLPDVSGFSGLKARCMAGHGGFLHLAGISRSWPKPSLPFPADPAGKCECRVSVLLSDRGELRRVERTARVNAPEAMMQPLLWYASAQAVEVTVSLRDADGLLYEDSFPLSAAPGHSGAAMWISPSGAAVRLSPVAAWSSFAQPEATESLASGRVITMKRGNPFALASQTQECGSAVRHVVAQPVGGGAYTRQFLYLFTDMGVMALTHDNDGLHRVCRPISARTVISPLQAAATSQGVWFLSTSGELLLVRDAVTQLFSQNLSPQAELAVDPGHSELLVCDREYDQAKVVGLARCPVDPLPYWTRPIARGALFLSSGSDLLEARTDESGSSWSLWLSESEKAAIEDAMWVSMPVEVDAAGETLVLFFGTGSDIEIWVRMVLPRRQGVALLAKVKADGPCSFPLMLPELTESFGYAPRPRLIFEVDGRLDSFDRFEVL